MRTRRLFISIILLLVAAADAFAGDYAHFHFIGFSKDGKYLAFEEYGTNDDIDDSSPYSSIYIIDVAKNSFAAAPFKATLNVYKDGDYDAIESAVRDKNRRRAAVRLKRFGIIDGNTGLQVAAHLINEYQTGDQDIREPAGAKMLPYQIAFTGRGNALYRVGYYEIKLKPVPVRQKNCDEYEREMFSFEMTLKNERQKTRVLEASGKVPKNRGCAEDYGIQEAYVYHNKLAVFVGIFTRGWEGDNLRLMAVTGELD